MFDLILVDCMRSHNDSFLGVRSMRDVNKEFKLSPVLRVGEHAAIRVPGDNTKMYHIIRRF